MPSLDCHAAAAFASAVLSGLGVSPEPARVTGEHLAENEAAGYPSHGLMRLPQYDEELSAGEINGSSIPETIAVTGSRGLLEGRLALGPYAMSFVVDLARELAEQSGVGVVTLRQAAHCGRLGAYVEQVAKSGYIGLAFCSGPRAGHRVAPFGGIQGRLATNPIAFAAPTLTEAIVADFSTSGLPEGKIRRLAEAGLPAPAGTLQDWEGKATTDAHVLYASPPGTLLPLGGSAFGHKGTALGLLVEILATTFAGEDASQLDRKGNNVTLLSFKVERDFSSRATTLVDYIKSSAPRETATPVLVPGEPEQISRLSGGILVDAQLAVKLDALGQRAGVAFKEYLA